VIGRVPGGLMSWTDLRVGQRVKAWHHGYIAASYPGQTLALKIKVEAETEEKAAP
jgi:hypothetical protein